MRKALIGIQAVLILALTGCLKDERYEDQEMGITITDKPAVAFPQASASPVVVGITGQAAAIVVDGPLVTLETSRATSNDVHVTLAYDQTLVTAAGLTPLPAGTFTLSTLAPVIPAGSSSVQNLKLTVTNTNTLDPNLLYGVGIKMVSVDGGYQLAANSKTMVIGFAIKNKYDGIYNLRGYHNRTSPDYTAPYNVTVHMITTGPNSVSMWYPDPGPDTYAHPIAGNTGGYYGTFTANFTFDPATNGILSWDWTPYATTLPTAMGPATDSRYVPAAGGNPAKIYANFYYNNNPAARAFFDTLTYIGPRP